MLSVETIVRASPSACDAEAQAEQFEAALKQRVLIPVEFEVTPPPQTPPDQPLYLSGSEPALGNWEAAGVPLHKGDDGKYRGTVEVTSGIEYAFKVTRGTWGTVEKGPNGDEIPNRPLVCDKPQKVEVQVASWVDEGKSVPTRVLGCLAAAAEPTTAPLRGRVSSHRSSARIFIT